MRATARRLDLQDDLLAAYAEHCEHLGLAASGRKDRLAAARRFLERHGDIGTWMEKPLEARLLDLERLDNSWPLVGFALLTGRVSADIDFLAAKHAGHTFAKAVAAIYPEDLAELRQAAQRLEWARPWERSVLSEALPLAVALTGKPPGHLSLEDLARLRLRPTSRS